MMATTMTLAAVTTGTRALRSRSCTTIPPRPMPRARAKTMTSRSSSSWTEARVIAVTESASAMAKSDRRQARSRVPRPAPKTGTRPATSRRQTAGSPTGPPCAMTTKAAGPVGGLGFDGQAVDRLAVARSPFMVGRPPGRCCRIDVAVERRARDPVALRRTAADFGWIAVALANRKVAAILQWVDAGVERVGPKVAGSTGDRMRTPSPSRVAWNLPWPCHPVTARLPSIFRATRVRSSSSAASELGVSSPSSAARPVVDRPSRDQTVLSTVPAILPIGHRIPSPRR